MNAAKKISHVIDAFFDKLLVIPVMMIGLLLLISVVSVAFRRILVGAFYWSDEAMRYLMVYATFLALPYMVANKKNVTIDLTDVLFPNKPSGKKMFYLACEVLTVIACAVLMPAGIRYITMNSGGASPSMHLPLSLVYSCIPVGFALSIVASLNNIFKLLTEGKEEIS